MYEVVTEHHIAATPAAVWAVLTDFPAYSAWNRFMVRVSGRARVGEVLSLGFKLGPVTVPISARVLRVDPGRELAWRGPGRGPTALGRVASGEHYWQLSPQGHGTRLIHGELFSGALLPLLWPLGRARLTAIFERSNRELAARVLAVATDASTAQ